MKKRTPNTPSVLSLDALSKASNSRLKVPVTLFRGTQAHPQRHLTLGELIAEIRTDNVEKLTHSQSMLYAYEQYLIQAAEQVPQAKAVYNELKNHLNGFLMGHFTYRANDPVNCAEYVSCLVFDLDSCVSNYHAFELQQKLQELDYVFSVFPSPSGHGLRILVWTSSTYETHRIVYKQVLAALAAHLNITTDRKEGIHLDATCENESRHFYYVAVKPQEFYLNLESSIFKIQTIQEEKIKKTIDQTKNTTQTEIPNDCIYIDAITEEVKIEFILKSIDMKKPRKLQCFDFGCLCHENNVDFDVAYHAALIFRDEEQKNPEKVIRTQLKDGYAQTCVKWNDAQFEIYLLKKHNIKVLSKNTSFLNITATPLTKNGVDEKIITNNLSISQLRNQKESHKYVSMSKFLMIKNYLLENYDFRRNVVANTIEYSVKSNNNWENLNENDLICELLEEGYTGVERLLKHLLGSSIIKDWDPFVDYFKMLPKWDGVNHIDHLASFVETTDNEWWKTMFCKALLRQAACSTGAIQYNKQCITLFGKTNNGKSKFVRFLLPSNLSKYIKENPDFSQQGNKDAILSIAKNFIINLDEIGNFQEKELKAIKTIFSYENVNERLIWDKHNTLMPRKATFWASTDVDEFLTDPQGSVRWVVIKVKNIRHDNGGENGYNKKVDINKVWAQVYHMLKNGFAYHLTKEEIEKSENVNRTEYTKVTKEDELIAKHFEPSNKQNELAHFKTATEIAIYLEQFTKSILNNRNIGGALKKLKFERISISGGVKGYYVKQKLPEK